MTEQAILQANSQPVSAEQVNPANAPKKGMEEKDRIPMTLPSLRLSVPEIPGYFCYWFLGKNVYAAQKAGYEFVSEEESELTNFDLAGDATADGNTDLGTRISRVGGSPEEGSKDPQRLYLMKLRNEWRTKDVQVLEAVNERIAATLRGGQPIGAGGPPEGASDVAKRYMKQGQDLFWPKKSRPT